MLKLQQYFSLFLMLLFLLMQLVCKSTETIGKDLRDTTKIKVQDSRIKDSESILAPDSIHFHFLETESDSNFTYTKYLDFLSNFSDTSKFIVLPLEKFRKTFNHRKIIIGLRHDVDLNLNFAHQLSMVENNIGIQSSYYILHTAPYYLADRNNMAIHNDSILPMLQSMQNKYHHEIGWHNDLVTLQVVYDMDPVSFFHQELSWLRNNGLKITGTASHGSSFCYTYNYLNYYFFNEYKDQIIGQFKNRDSVSIGNKLILLKHASLKDFNLNYEAYFLNNNKYFSDAKFINGERWNPGMLDIESLKPGDRVIILTHPIYYWPNGSKASDLISFNIPGQLKSDFNPGNLSIEIEMPAGERIDRLHPIFDISTNATAWIGQQRVESGYSPIDFTKAVKFRIIAENALDHRDWTVKIKLIETKFTIYPNPSTGFVSLQFDNITTIDSRLDIYNTVGAIVYSEIINQKGSFTYSRNFAILPTGIYFLKLTTGNKQLVQRFLRN